MLHCVHHERSYQIFGVSNAKLWPRCLSCRVRRGKEEPSDIDIQGDYA